MEMKNKEIIWSMGEPYYRYVKFDGLQFLCQVSLKNPFKKYYYGIVVPKIEFLPRVALTINRKDKSAVVEIGFLNFYFSLFMYEKYKIVTTKVEGEEYNRLKQEYEKQFHTIEWQGKN